MNQKYFENAYAQFLELEKKREEKENQKLTNFLKIVNEQLDKNFDYLAENIYKSEGMIEKNLSSKITKEIKNSFSEMNEIIEKQKDVNKNEIPKKIKKCFTENVVPAIKSAFDEIYKQLINSPIIKNCSIDNQQTLTNNNTLRYPIILNSDDNSVQSGYQQIHSVNSENGDISNNPRVALQDIITSGDLNEAAIFSLQSEDLFFYFIYNSNAHWESFNPQTILLLFDKLIEVIPLKKKNYIDFLGSLINISLYTRFNLNEIICLKYILNEIIDVTKEYDCYHPHLEAPLKILLKKINRNLKY
ncbi:hypothetical protein DMUE_5157 [Dictyocoela muelleri]|nr:hypothetical protein DMUE_5157 [Dictyocoela muelleri]